MRQEDFEKAYFLGMEAAWCIARKTEDLRKEGKFADCYGKEMSLWEIPAKEALAAMILYEERVIRDETK